METSPAQPEAPLPISSAPATLRRPVALAWTLTSATEGQPLDVRAALIQARQTPDHPLKGRSARVAALPLSQLQSLRAGDVLSVPLLDGSSALAKVNLATHDVEGWQRVAGSLEGTKNGSFVLASNGKSDSAVLLLPSQALAYELIKERDGHTWLVEKPLADVVCFELPRPRDEPAPLITDGDARIQDVPPVLSSRPQATAVIYIDFDGETVTDPGWNNGNTIVAAPSSLTTAQMTEVFNRVKEDFWPFNVDITTNLARYTSAPIGKRMRCIVTPTATAAPSAGGVALLSSFSRAGTSFYSSNVPCWVFNNTVKSIAEAVSHEVGHTLGLQHDGILFPPDGYYEGHGTGAVGWAPIMGASYYKELTQWSKGEYAGADQQQDDIAIIGGSTNGFGFVSDEAGGTLASAANLSVNASSQFSVAGIITQASDIDYYTVNVSAGRIQIDAKPATIAPNLDISLQLINSAGSVVASSNPDLALDGTLNASVTAGQYYIKVQGTGRGEVLGTGYSAYGSIGAYTLTGSIPGTAQAPVFTSATSAFGTVGEVFLFNLTAANSPTSFAVQSGTLPSGLSLNTTTGAISGTPTSTGSFTVTLSATNSVGVGTRLMTFVISNAITLADALDTTGLTWTSSGNKPWRAQTNITADAVDAAQSGAITADQTSSLSTTITGPCTLSFKWQVDSESGYDILRFSVDGAVKAAISGSTTWAVQTLTIPAGNHVVQWDYLKDSTVSEGLDAGWVDQVTITPPLPPVITSAANVAGTVGQAFTYQIVATNSPLSYHVLAGTLPAGLTLNSTTGLVSGVPTSAVTPTVTFGATNAAGTGALAVKISISSSNITLADALDTPDLVFSTGGTAPWFGQTANTYDGIDAARSGVISHSQTSWMETTVTGPAIVTFRWRVDSEEGFDFLTVRDNGALAASISGAIDWTLRTINVPAGSHTLRWGYEKDSNRTVGADAGWIDSLSVVNATTRTLAVSGDLAFGNIVTGTTATRVLTLTNTGNADITVSGITYPAGFSGAYAGILPPGATQSINVLFTPTALANYGTFLTINSDATPPAIVRAISGSGVSQVPANDLFTNATTLSGSIVNVEADNTTAGVQAGEPNHYGIPAQHSLWWRWTAPASGYVAVNTVGSGFDTVLAVYRGTSLSNLVTVASDDEYGGNHTSLVIFTATVGTTYYIAVDGYYGDTGSVSLHLNQVSSLPSNDNFASSYLLTGTNLQSMALNLVGSRETGEPVIISQATGRSLWWTWTAPYSGRLLLDTNGSSFDTILAVYQGTAVNALGPRLAFDDQDPSSLIGASSLVMNVDAGATYRIVVDGYGGEYGLVALNLRLVTPPVNDSFASAILLSGSVVSDTGNNLGASKETGELAHANSSGGASVWWKWVAPITGRATISTAGSRVDTLLAIYTGVIVSGLNPVASNDDGAADGTSKVTFNVTAGTTYNIAVDGYQASMGTIKLSIAVYVPPANDTFASATPIQGTHLQLTGTNLGASKQTNEPNHAGDVGGNSVWWKWVAPASGQISLDTRGSDFDTTLGVYTGNSVNLLTLVKSNDEAEGEVGDLYGISALTFTATANTTYYFAVDGYQGATGNVTLNFDADLFLPPTITQNPSSQTITAGQSALFTVTATGTAPLSYQWRKNGTAINGATSASFAIGSALESDAGAYSVVVSNSVSNVTSTDATLTVNPAAVAPAIVTQPVSVTTSTGQSVSFTVVASGTAPLAYQWRKDTVAINGATSATLTLTGVTGAQAGAYSVVVTNSAGSVTSANATLTITASLFAPSIATQPQSQTVASGGTFSLSVAANGNPAPTYQWFRNGQAVAGATSATFTRSNAQPGDAGLYTVTATNSLGSVTSNTVAVGLTTTELFVGSAFSDPAWRTLQHPSGRVYTQILLTGSSATVTADPGKVTRISYVDLQDDIVQLEFSGAGSMTVTLDNASGPALPVKYNQAIEYMRGHATVTIQGADADTFFSAFSVGTATAVNQTLFRSDVTYDGHADLARLIIRSSSGQFGGLFMGNAAFNGTVGLTGIYAPGVTVINNIRTHDVTAFDAARPVLQFGSTPNSDNGIRITGGNLEQSNARAIELSGVNQVTMGAGTDSHGRSEPAQTNKARFETNGVDVTTGVVVNPSP